MAIGDRRLVIETRAILVSDDWRDENEWTDQLFERIHGIESKYGVRCEGEISAFLLEQETQALLTAIETHARLVAAHLEPPQMRTPGVAIKIVPQSQTPANGLRGPEMRGDSWARVAPRIRDKVQTAAESGANWLRVDAREGLWQFTDWSTLPLTDKLQAFHAAVRGILDGLDGIVVSCGPLLAQGAFVDEDVAVGPGLVALRRLLPFSRVRETLIIATDPTAPGATPLWLSFYSDEPSWLDWALAFVSKPSLEQILAR